MDTHKIISELGGTSAVAKLCHITPGAVSQWRKAGIPKTQALYLRALRPDIFRKLTRQPINGTDS